MQKPNPFLMAAFIIGGALSFLGIASLFLKIAAGIAPPLSTDPETSRIQFIDRGRVIKTVTKAQLLEIFGTEEKIYFEHREARDVVYNVIPAARVLAWAFGKDAQDVPRWTKAQNLAFKSYDSSESFVPTSRLNRFTAFFAVSRKGAPNFSLRNDLQGGATTLLAPLSMVWDNKGNVPLLKEGAVFIPNQITSVALADDSKLFAEILPRGDSSDQTRRGFAVFKSHCIFCHSIGGAKDTMGGDLLRAPSCFESELTRLRSWVLNPRDPAIGDGTSPMNSLLEVDPENAVEKAEAVLTYLCAVSRG